MGRPPPDTGIPNAERVTAGSISLDRSTHRVHRSGREISLGPTEFKLLGALMGSQGAPLTRQQLILEVWAAGPAIDERTVDVHIGRLRRSLSRGRESDPIVTVRGIGYKFEARS